MIHNIKTALVIFFLVTLTSCTALVEPIKPQASTENLPSCYILFDAGSSGTRLYVYEKQADSWLEHVGPKVSALADPVREFRGKKHADIDAVTTEVVSTLDGIKQNDSINHKWQAFDWTKQCHVVSAMVYGTAGMRIAEQKNRAKSIELLSQLKQKLQTKVGDAVHVSTRTLTGYEEGLYAWLTVREQQKNHNFGIVEMGGASSQVTFPCPKCDPADDAVKSIMLNGNPVQLYSYSFLGLGQDEAPKTLGIPDSCAYGIGTSQPDWEEQHCAKKIAVSDNHGIRDPYNFKDGQQGTHRKIPTHQADVNDWFLTGTFNDMDDDRIDTCCVNKGQCSTGISSCFRPIYFGKYLQSLNIPKTAQKLDVSWTLGVVICSANNCLQKATPLICRWSAKGCL